MIRVLTIILVGLNAGSFPTVLTEPCFCTRDDNTPVFEEPSLFAHVNTFTKKDNCFVGNTTDGWLTDLDNEGSNLLLETVYQHECLDTEREENTGIEKRSLDIKSWTQWTTWTECDGECGDNGMRTRTRTCFSITTQTSVSTFFCNGIRLQEEPCYLNCTKYPFTHWSPWGFCNEPCDRSLTTRNRTCRIDHCSGNHVELKQCEPNLCAVDGHWSDWGDWNPCPMPDSFQVRYRACIDPPPKNGGNDCDGQGYSLKICTIKNNTYGVWEEWGDWSECYGAIECNHGQQFRLRMCLENGTCIGDDYERANCTIENCTVDGQWADWNNWTSCSVTCGTGLRRRDRTCTNPTPAYNGENCTGDDTDVRNCSSVNHCPVDGEYMDWSLWSNCSVSCGTDGFKTRHRVCSAPKYGGHPCDGSKTTEIMICSLKPCADWSEWFHTPCTTTCGTGTQTRLRHCSSGHSEDCAGPSKEQAKCSENPCPVDGAWSPWSNVSSCSVTCANGTSTRTRTCSNPQPINGGKQCTGDASESEDCHNEECPEWSLWFSTGCSVTCGVGNQTKIRHCSSGHSEDCDGADKEHSSCTNAPCPVDGSWTDWTDWSACDVTCESGLAHRTRTCTNPAPDYGGANCTGSSSSIRTCTLQTCPSWSEWFGGDCTVTCGGGTQSRLRFCSTGHDEDCPGDPFSSAPCSANSC